MSKRVLSQLSEIKKSDIILSPLQVNNIPNSKLTYKKVLIGLSKNGVQSDFIVSTLESFCFGLKENTAMNNPDEITGYTLPLALWNREGPSVEQRAWTDNFTRIIENIKELLLERKEEYELYTLEMSDLKKFGNKLYWKRERGQIVEGTGPTLYAPLMISKKNDTFSIRTEIFDSEGNQIDPFRLKDNYCKAKIALKIESIYFGNSISLQLKVLEAKVAFMENSGRSLLVDEPIGNMSAPAVSSNTNLPRLQVESESEEEEMPRERLNNATNNDELSDVSDYEQVPTPKPKPTPVRKTTAKKTK